MYCTVYNFQINSSLYGIFIPVPTHQQTCNIVSVLIIRFICKTDTILQCYFPKEPQHCYLLPLIKSTKLAPCTDKETIFAKKKNKTFF